MSSSLRFLRDFCGLAFAARASEQKLELSLTTGGGKSWSFGLLCDNQTGREGFAEKTGTVDRGDRDERAKSCKL